MNRFYVITNVEKDKDLKTTRQIYDYLKARGANVRCANSRKRKRKIPGEITVIQTRR